jgi:hypothetical protein
VWDKPTVLKILDEVWAGMPIEQFHPDLLWFAKKLPENQNSGRELGRVGEEEHSVSRAWVLDILYMF